MRTLKESILSKTADKVKGVGVDIDKMTLFGNIFKLKECKRLCSKTLQCISIKGIKNATKDMDYLDDNVERGIFDRQNKGKMLCNFIEHINLVEWGFVDVDWKNDRTKRDEFGKRLRDELESRSCFNSRGNCWINSLSFRDDRDFIIMFDGGKPWSFSDTFSLVFELR